MIGDRPDPPVERRIREIEPGAGRVVLVVVAHADDLALRCGGAVGRMSDAGWRVVLARVTDDATDSVGLDIDDTIRSNTLELAEAAAILGVDETLELGYRTDRLASVPILELRERCVRLLRELRPYATMSFDPSGGPGEDNEDHLRVGAAMAEAHWTAMFDKHHPEHRTLGLAPHGVFERWWFSRAPQIDTIAIDISSALKRKTRAVLAHRTMVENMIEQARLMGRTAGIVLEAGSEAAALTRLIRHRAEVTGAAFGVGPAETFRVERFSDLGWNLRARAST